MRRARYGTLGHEVVSVRIGCRAIGGVTGVRTLEPLERIGGEVIPVAAL